MADRVTGTTYLDPGDRLSGRHNPPRRCVVLVRWRHAREAVPAPAWLSWTVQPRRAPRNVLVAYSGGTRAVVPFTRRLRRTQLRHLGDGYAPFMDLAACSVTTVHLPYDTPNDDHPIRTPINGDDHAR